MFYNAETSVSCLGHLFVFFTEAFHHILNLALFLWAVSSYVHFG
jgi:hypothetical protein